MSLAKRIAVFTALWLLAGVICAVFSDIIVEPGDSEFLARLQLVYLAPLVFVVGIVFTLGHFDHWQQTEFYGEFVSWLLGGFFLFHAFVSLTRRTRRQFVALWVIQILFLAASVSCVLYYFHYDALHGRG